MALNTWSSGNYPGPGTFCTQVYPYISEQNDTNGYHIKFTFRIHATNAYSTIKANWNGSSYYCGAGTVNVGSGDLDGGWHKAGETVTKSSYSGYTGGSGNYYKSTVNGTTGALPYVAPSAPTGASVTRDSDTQATITWTNNSNARALYQKLNILRSTDGGEYTQIASLDFSAAVTSYVDTSTQPNHSYQYIVQAYNPTGTANSTATATIYNTPATPTGLSAVYSAGSGSVVVTWNDNAIDESGFELQSADNADFTSPSTYTLAANATTYTDAAPPMGDAYYRIRAKAGALYSAWSDAFKVVTLTAPAAPTLLSPASSAVLDMPASITFEWRHNPLDNTEQTAAEIYISTTSASSGFTKYTVNGAQNTYTLVHAYPANTQVWWYVKTKGAYASYSPASAVRSFYVRQAPSFTITDPVAVDYADITDVPVIVDGTYTDNSGTLASASVRVSQGGRTLFTTTASSFPVTIAAADFLPANQQDYTVSVTVNSTSGLSATSSRIFSTNYDEPAAPTIDLVIDEQTGSVQITVVPQPDDQHVPPIDTEGVGLFRVTDKETPVVAFSAGELTVVDYVPPVDKPFKYRAVAYAASGVASETIVDVIVNGHGFCFFNFGGNFEEFTKVGYDTDYSDDRSPDGETFKTPTRVLARYGDITERSHSIQGTKTEDDFMLSTGAHDIETLADFHGSVWVREPGRWPFLAKIDRVSSGRSNPRFGSVSVSCTEVG